MKIIFLLTDKTKDIPLVSSYLLDYDPSSFLSCHILEGKTLSAFIRFIPKQIKVLDVLIEGTLHSFDLVRNSSGLVSENILTHIFQELNKELSNYE